LLLNAVAPNIGGVLVRGDKGTAKSTVVRALAGLLPPLETVAGCRFSCDPAAADPSCPDGPHGPVAVALRRPARLVELPLGATEDRLAGSLDLQRALTDGVKAYEPGLLAAANRGLLYVDEVNLLPDHLVDLLLDAAAMGSAYIERDGVSVRHAARFLLVGTMNPEEGELRPQLLDRFGVAVDVTAPSDVADRAEVVRRRLAYEADPDGFAVHWAGQDAGLASQIVAARARLPRVSLPDRELARIAHVCASFDVDGMRADLVVARAAMALAAWRDRGEVTEAEVRDSARLALPHRRRRDPLDPTGLDSGALDEAMRRARAAVDPAAGAEPDDASGRRPDRSDPGPEGMHRRPAGMDPGTDGMDPGTDDTDPRPHGPDWGPDGGGRVSGDAADGGTGDRYGAAGMAAHRGAKTHSGSQTHPGAQTCSGAQRVATADRPYRARLLVVPGTGTGTHRGRRSPAFTRPGRVVAARIPAGRLTSVHVPATVAAAAQRDRGRTPFATRDRPLIAAADLREAVHKGREGNLVLFVVDASGSMAARERMRAVKGAVLSLLRDAYQRRDKVGLITFRADRAELVLPPTSSHEIGAARLRQLATGGRTPLAAGLRAAAEAIRVHRLRDPRRRVLVVIVTDGRATSGPDPIAVAAALRGTVLRGIAAVVVDCESGPVRLRLAGRLAFALSARYLSLEEVSAHALRDLGTRGPGSRDPITGDVITGTSSPGAFALEGRPDLAPRPNDSRRIR
jgi:magnesium chelatase subunit D